MNNNLIQVLIILLIIVSPLYDVRCDEVRKHDYRSFVTKAEVLLMEGYTQQALAMILPNIVDKKFHLGSYLLLAKIHEAMGVYSRSLKVYYYIIKKYHDIKILDVARMVDGEKSLDKFARPEQFVLEIYFSMLTAYKRMYEFNKVYTTSQRERFLDHADTLSKILNHYSYRKTEVAIYNALFKGWQGEHIQAIKQYHVLRKLEPSMKDNPEIDYLIGRELFQLGEREMAMAYFQSAIDSDKVSPKLARYTQQVLESISEKEVYGKLALAGVYRSNINRLSASEVNDFATTHKDTYGAVGGNLLSKKVGLNIGFGAVRGVTSRLHFEFDDESYTSNAASINDQRDATVGTSIVLSGLFTASISFRFDYQKRWRRPGAGDSLSIYSDSYKVSMKQSFALNSGAVVLEASYTPIYYSNNEKGSLSYGSLMYSPLGIDKTWRPGFHLDLFVQKNTSWPLDSSRSVKIGPAVSGRSFIGKRLSFFQYLSYRESQSKLDKLSYKELALDLNLLYLFKLSRDFGLNLGISGYYRTLKLSDSSRGLSGSVGISYYF